ncbi:hypothetical protein [Micromonospora sp. NPDC023633]|uniref:hypothetical protein n=1 Tax=Micromonospora sp. NPDC023633 TaxID=3154320 RepID=UPI0034036BA5
MSPRRLRRRPPLIRLGAPGPYVLAAAFATAAWSVARLLDGSGGSPAGALVGLAGGIPLFGGMAALALALDRPLTAGLHGLVLVAVLAVAALTLGRVRRLERSLDGPGQGG